MQEDLDFYVVPPSLIAHKPYVPLSDSQYAQSMASSNTVGGGVGGRLSRMLHRHPDSNRTRDRSSSVYSRMSHMDNQPVTLPEPYDPALKDSYNYEPPDYADMVYLKLGVGKKLLAKRGIFSALRRARQVSSAEGIPDAAHLPHGETPAHLQAAGTAEKHLLDMLCASGFNITDEWGSREREPSKTVISSLALVRLLATEENDSADAGNVTTTINPMAQKLLLFWRKPARKCWWDRLLIKGIEGFDPELEVKVHVRRMWTLELSVVGVH